MNAEFSGGNNPMKQSVLRRVLALVLTLSFLLGGGVAATSAVENENDAPSSITDTSLADVKDLLNSASYSEYCAKELFMSTGRADSSIKIDATVFDAAKTTADVSKVKIDPVTGVATIVADDYQAKDGEIVGLYTPDSDEVAFPIEIPATAKYSIAIEYYPAVSIVDENGKTIATDKSGAIERILKIDGKVPFSEARYIVMAKIWKNIYTIKMATLSTTTDANGNPVSTYEDTAPYIARAEKCGIAYKVADDKSSITLELPDGGWTSELVSKLSEEDLRFFTTDIDNNEIRCTMERVPELRSYECKDVDGFYSDTFEFIFEKGERTLSLEAKSQGCVIKSITLFPQREYDSYEEVLAGYAQNGYVNGSDKIKIEAEFPFATSSQTIYPVEDSSSAVTSPAATDRTILNTIGGEKWQTSGQWIRYSFQVNTDGKYQIVTRFRQNINDGMFSSRILYIYSDGLNEGDAGYYNGIPFAEAANLRFGYSTDWQVAPLKFSKETADGWQDVEIEFYFKAGVTYTIEMEVSLGDMGNIVSEVNTSLTNINNYYLNILKLTGAEPDQYRDYGFNRIMPDTMQGLILESRRLYNIAEELKNIAGSKSSNVATLEKIAWLLNEMGTDEDNVAKYMEQLKTYIGTLGTWINDNKTQPLQFDYLMVQGTGAELPKAKANFFQALGHEVARFIQSFFRNYDRMGATTENTTGDDVVEVWLAKGRDQTQVIRNLINNDFTPEYGHLVDLKLVAGGTLLPSILAGAGPDVYIGVSEDNIVNYAIRGALNNIENFDGFYDLTSQYEMEHMTIKDYIEELKSQNYIIVGEDTNTIKAMSADGKAMYTIKINADGSGETTGIDIENEDKEFFENGFTKEGWLYKTGEAFSGVTYVYKNVLDENGNKVKNEDAQFNEAAMFVLGVPDADGIMHYYGLPEEQNFAMMFVRNDILADLGLEIPRSWDDIQAAIPVLQANNMEIGMHNDYKIFLYQEGSQLFADDGMRINLDSNVALDSFDYMCNLFTMYSFPYKYDFSNRFRTGEMPIGIAGYNGTYNQLIVFATEIRGLWSFYPIPGITTETVDADGNTVESINNIAVATVSSISMISGSNVPEKAWDFMRWHVGAECQVDYSNEMVAILGDSAKYATANITALESMPWTTAEYEQLQLQFNNLASIPNYPGTYIIGRYTKFAFLAAYDDKENPADALNKYVTTINKEISRKRAEFDLETIEIGETLASKRISQALTLIDSMSDADKAKYKTEIDNLKTAIDNLESQNAYASTERIQAVEAAVKGLRNAQHSAFFKAADYLDQAIKSLYEYQASY